ncbi:MAG: hypothetical protein ACLGI3_04120, partial [Actinomycetes bacterium]
RTLGALTVAALLAAPAGSAAAAAGPPEPAGPAVSGPGLPGPRPPAPDVSVPGPVGAPAVGASSPGRTQASGKAMTGQFLVSGGKCGSGATPEGSYFSMLDPSGNPVDNGDSPCSDKSATPVAAGAEGLLPGRFQPFAASPGATRAIVAPTTFFGSPFAVATQGPDKQSGASVEAPSVLESGGKLSGQVSAFQAFYNGAYYNQGAPKPGGGTPGRTTAGVTGTYDAGTGAFVLEWRSTITGGAFNNFTGVWHLEGTYKAAATGTSGSTTPPAGQGGGTGAPAAEGATSGAPATTPQAGGPLLADTGLPATGTYGAVLALCALALGAWRRRTGWAS